LDAPIEQQRALLELQEHDSAIDRLGHRRESLPEHARLAELGTSLAAIDQLAAERRGELATVSREQTRLEDDVEMVRRKAETEEARAISGRVTSPKELTAIQDEVAALHRRQSALEDDLLERMERRETLDAELAELGARREGVGAEQAEVAKARDAALAQVEHELQVQRDARAALAPKISEQLFKLYEQIRARQGGVGAAALVGNTCQGCRVSLSHVELNALRALPPERIKRCENCRRILVIE
jgi:predicted  nucleic acid-binding Zn-ribbon protein